jgi:hypothetical protein
MAAPAGRRSRIIMRIRLAGKSTSGAVLMGRVRRALLWRPHVGDCLIFVASGP